MVSCDNITSPDSDVYLSLNDVFIPNNGYVIISDIGTVGDDTALLCHTNHPPPSGSSHSGGGWFRPDGSEVSPSGSSVGFRRNRGSMVVRLYRNTATDPPVEGIYYCQIEDDTNTFHIVSVGLYNSVGGNVHSHLYLYWWTWYHCHLDQRLCHYH